MKKITMNISRFLVCEREENALRKIEVENEVESSLEKFAGTILKNKRLTKLAVFTIAAINHASTVLADVNDATSKINQSGFMILGIAQTLGYWLCIISCVMEILKTVMNGSSKEVGKIMLKYIMIFASLYLMPWLFNLIKDIFE